MTAAELRRWLEDVPDSTKIRVRYYDSELGWERKDVGYAEPDGAGVMLVVED